MVEKRKSDRIKAIQPPLKRTRLSEQVKQEETPEPTPEPDAPVEVGRVLLPNKIYDTRPLPTLPEAQATAPADDEYQSIDQSRTLASSLQRSRDRWLSGEFLERYWIKSKKTAQIPNNPNKNTMAAVPSNTSSCTIIVEPLILEAKVYYVKDASALHNTGAQSAAAPLAAPAYGATYRHGSSPHMPAQNGPFQQQPAYGRPSISSANKSAPPASNQSAQDPVIQLLAARASQDPVLKELMKNVANGDGTPQQLQTFQRYIDDLKQVVARDASNAASAKGSPAPMQQSRHGTPQSHQSHPQQPRMLQQQAPRARTTVPPPYPVVLEFAGSSASPDRFLFPKHAIVESLGSHSILASFLIFRKGSEATDPSLFVSDQEYYEPVTIKIDVQQGDTEVLSYIKRSVENQGVVQSWMKEQMAKKKRACIRYLPLRLPLESQIPESEEEPPPPPPPPTTKKRGPYKKREKVEQAPTAELVAAPPEIEPEATPMKSDGDVLQEGSRRVSKRSTRLLESLGE